MGCEKFTDLAWLYTQTIVGNRHLDLSSVHQVARLNLDYTSSRSIPDGIPDQADQNLLEPTHITIHRWELVR